MRVSDVTGQIYREVIDADNMDCLPEPTPATGYAGRYNRVTQRDPIDGRVSRVRRSLWLLALLWWAVVAAVAYSLWRVYPRLYPPAAPVTWVQSVRTR